MRCLRSILLAGILATFPIALGAFSGSNCVPVYTTAFSDVAFVPGEDMGFVLHYRFGLINSDIGTARVCLDTLSLRGVKCFHTQVTGQTRKAFDRFFKVRENFNSYFTCDGMMPLRFTRDTYEGGYHAWNEYSYIWDAPSPYIDAQVFTTSLGTTKALQIPLKGCTFDLPSLFFFARNIDMTRVKPDVKYPMTFAIDDEVYDVYFIYKGRKVKKVKGLGTIRCLEFAAQLLKGEVFRGDHDMTIYISDDLNRLPVLFGAPILVGNVEGRMTDVKGLKYPFSSKISD